MTKAAACVVCGKPSTEKYSPFCTKRCADIDLNRWFTESYSVPGEEADHADDVPPSPEAARFEH